MKKIFSLIISAGLFLSSLTIASRDNAVNAASESKVIALTFDDGPNTTTTNDVLDILAEYNAKASFFLIGDNINAESAASVKRAYEMGMEIDNHSKTHSNMSKMSAEQVKAEISYVDERIKEITGESAKFFRPPFIDVSQSLYDAVDLPFICGIDCQDYMQNVTTQERADYILNGAKDGVIVLLHDAAGNQQTVEALKIVMPELVKQGYEFVTLTELFERQGETPKHNILYSNVGKYPEGYEFKQELTADPDRIALDKNILETLGDTYAIETDYVSASGYPPVIALQKWSGTPQIWHTIQPFYFNGDKAVFLAGDIITALKQLGVSCSDLDGISVTAYTGEISLSNAKLLVKSKVTDTITGDVNMDGVFNIADVVTVQNWLLGRSSSGMKSWQAADLCNDGAIDSYDLCLLRSQLVQK
ncbi:MAG: polysaccharide deacetylase family protein [Ruminococcus sp.]|nr:polysaccharide deacetylase family protein [Ruminococcus sp.]